MLKILLTNDDGLKSPALIPTIEILKKIGNVNTIIPLNQQSWTSKINTRRSKQINLEEHIISGHKIITLDAFPADCANFGLFDDLKPDLLVSGANIGHNVGLGAYLSSGTIGAALEGILADVPSIAISIPYNKGDNLNANGFATSLKNITKLIQSFICNRPEIIKMISLNLPFNKINNKFMGVKLDKFSFKGLFKRTNGHIVPKDYYELPRPTSGNINTDTWARFEGINSVIALDQLAQLVDSHIVNKWLQNEGLAFHNDA